MTELTSPLKAPPPDSAGERIAQLEQQMALLQSLLMDERARHQEEKRASETTVRLLRHELMQKKSPGTAVPQPRSRLVDMSLQSPRREIASTPRTADNLFPTEPASAAAIAQTRKHSVRARTPPARSSRLGVVSPARTEPPVTALQHAWNKFCVIAQSDFTPHQLQLLSAETLQRLLEHYHVRSSIERAQIEGQWALLQEGKTSVEHEATPRMPRSTSRRPIHRAEHPAPFQVEPEHRGPHLSRRNLINAEGTKSSNPNICTSKAAFTRTLSGTVLLRPRSPAPSNPNDLDSPSTPRPYCFAHRDYPAAAEDRPSNRRHTPPPAPRSVPHEGIRSEGRTQCSAEASAPSSGKRTKFSPRCHDETRRGVRTYEPASSPTRAQRPHRVVNSPLFEQRTTLSTATLAQKKGRRLMEPMSPIQSRTPFALGPSISTANSRAE